VNEAVLGNTRNRSVAQFARYLPDSVAEELSTYSISVRYVKGSTLIVQGFSADATFWIISGVVKIYCLVPNGNRILLKLAGPGDVLGYPTLLGPEGEVLQPFEVQTLTECTVAMISRGRLIGSIEQLNQATSINLLERLNHTWSLVARRQATFLGCSFRQRLELAFEELASRFGVEDDRGFLLSLKLSHIDFAEMIGSSRPMVPLLCPSAPVVR
jgi:CRP/FNR family transcriptional regulator, cyclic AMP receptor protein